MNSDGTNEEKLEPCLVPWVSLATNPFGKTRPCGYSSMKSRRPLHTSSISSEFNNELFRSIRKDFIEGRWPENCSRCKKMEEAEGEVSKRKIESRRPDAKKIRALIQQTHPDGRVSHYPRQIDIRLGTVCNLKCIHCGTGNSSKWLEDKNLLGKYPNTQVQEIDNSWVDQKTQLWVDLIENLHQIEKFNFIGGEPFASQQHWRFVQYVCKTPYAERISLHYVTNGILVTPERLNLLSKFKHVTLNVSLDMTGRPLEFFRYPTKSEKIHSVLSMLEEMSYTNFKLRIQWTASNISMFYLKETLAYWRQNFPRMPFRFCNFVDYPAHMSPQNLPEDLKKRIEKDLAGVIAEQPIISFYVDYMKEKSLWPSQGETFLRYLDDLSGARSLSWKESFSDFYGALHDRL